MRDQAWIIALAHCVDDSDHPCSCCPAVLDSVLAGLAILPVCDVIGKCMTARNARPR